MRTGLSRWLVSSVIAAVIASTPASARTPAPVPGGISNGRIEIEVVDPDGSPLPGVTVEARAPGSDRTFIAVTGANGRTTLPGVPVGIYDIRASKEGFGVWTQRITVTVGQAQTVRIALAGPVPGGIPSGPAVEPGATDLQGDAATVEIVSINSSDDLEIQKLLRTRAAKGWLLASTIPLADRSTLFVFSKVAVAAKCVSNVVTKAITKEDLADRLAQHPSKRFRGIHRLSATAYVFVLCDE